ncbi:hypothetical protein ACLQ24_28570 [Micromonospora sp. DT4]|uniref:hypothetical protein n=1 Tax=Micromonospora sp. DT4 TaxID=3393438 RepID=UPI003CEA3479
MSEYSYTAEPVRVTPQAGDSYLVLTRVSGDFPGSPIDARWRELSESVAFGAGS